MKISNGCIVLIRDSEEVDDLKHEQESLRQQLRNIKQVNKDIKSVLSRIANYINKLERSDDLSSSISIS